MNLNNRSKNILLVVLSSVIALAIAEFVILERLFESRDRPSISFEESGLPMADPAFQAETAALYEEGGAHPLRWYYLAQNFDGEYWHTDELGYRVDRGFTRHDAGEFEFEVGVFGGSSTFSILTGFDYSIPALLAAKCDNPDVRITNYGIGGYSSSAELGAFIEILRHRNIDHAIFYDGVNEIGRYIEAFQMFGGENAVYSRVGFPYDPANFDFISYHLRPDDKLRALRQWNIGRVLAKAIIVSGLVQYTNYEDSLILHDTEHHASTILDIYERNIADILSIAKENQVTVEFFWQPSVYMKNALSEPEGAIIRTASQADRELNVLVSEQIATIGNVKDISDVFDATESQVFYDSVHLGKSGNVIVADRLFEASSYLRERCRQQSP